MFPQGVKIADNGVIRRCFPRYRQAYDSVSSKFLFLKKKRQWEENNPPGPEGDRPEQDRKVCYPWTPVRSSRFSQAKP